VFTPLRLAVDGGHTGVVKVLLAAGADMEKASYYDGKTARETAVKKGHHDIVVLLDEVREKYGELVAAVARGDVESVGRLVAEGAGANIYRGGPGTALYEAAVNGHAEIVKMLAESVGDKYERKEWCGKAIVEAAARGHTEAVKALLDAGGDVMTKKYMEIGTTQSCAAIQEAVENGHAETVNVLLQAVSSANQTMVNRESFRRIMSKALEFAIGKGYVETVRNVMEKVVYYRTWRTLEEVAGEGHIELVKLLLDSVNPSTRQRAREAADRKGHHEIVKYIDEHQT